MNEILIVKCLSDNYAYIYSNKNGDAFVVDPSEAGPVIDVLNKHKLNLKFILNTCLLYTSPSPRDSVVSRMPSSA